MHLTEIVTHLGAETDRLVTTARGLTDADVAGPSLCAGWTRGHVLSHLARNAEALGRVCTVVLTGEPDTMYDSPESRDTDIEAGAGRGAAEQAADVEETAAALAPAIGAIGLRHVGVTVERTPGGQIIPAERVPFMRLREVVWHHVDLDAGYTFADAPDELVQLFLVDAVSRLASTEGAPGLRIRTTEGDVWTVGNGSVDVSGPRHAVLLWLARGDTSGVASTQPIPPLPSGG